jgi:regulator of replication initiation timing
VKELSDLKSTVAELNSSNEDLKRNNAALKKQMAERTPRDSDYESRPKLSQRKPVEQIIMEA